MTDEETRELLEDEILYAIQSGCSTFAAIRHSPRVHPLLNRLPSNPERQLDRRLQSLRRRDRIGFDRTLRAWLMVLA